MFLIVWFVLIAGLLIIAVGIDGIKVGSIRGTVFYQAYRSSIEYVNSRVQHTIATGGAIVLIVMVAYVVLNALTR
jgi:hypothetical protein